MLQEVTIDGQEVASLDVNIDVDLDRNITPINFKSDKVAVEEKRTKEVVVTTDGETDFPHAIEGGVVITVNGNEHEVDGVYRRSSHMKAEPGMEMQVEEELVGTKTTIETHVKDKEEVYGFL